MLKYRSLQKIADEATKNNVSIGAYVLRDQALQMETTEEKILEVMEAGEQRARWTSLIVDFGCSKSERDQDSQGQKIRRRP